MDVYDTVTADTLGPGDRIRVEDFDYLIINVEDNDVIFVDAEPLDQPDGETEFMFNPFDLVDLVK